MNYPPILSDVEELVLEILTQFVQESESDANDAGICIQYPSATRNSFFCKLSMRYQRRSTPTKHNTIDFPRGSGVDFAQLLKLLSFCYSALVNEKRLSLRDLYYLDVALFKSQQESNRTLDRICAMLSTPRSRLNVHAAAKGLVMGNLECELNGACFSCQQPSSIPPLAENITAMNGMFDFVLVVEKETVFRRLCDDGFAERNRCLLVTGKGVPCLSTRQFLSKIQSLCPAMEMFGLFDADPYGASIYCNYKYGSRRTCLEVNCTLPQLQWIGVFLSDLDEAGRGSQALPLSQRDTQRLHGLMASPQIKRDPVLSAEVEAMLERGIKAETESLAHSDPASPRGAADTFLLPAIQRARERALIAQAADEARMQTRKRKRKRKRRELEVDEPENEPLSQADFEPEAKRDTEAEAESDQVMDDASSVDDPATMFSSSSDISYWAFSYAGA